MELLNKEQKYAVDCVMNGCNILLTGSAGTGKSYTIKYIMECLRNNNKNIINHLIFLILLPLGFENSKYLVPQYKYLLLLIQIRMF